MRNKEHIKVEKIQQLNQHNKKHLKVTNNTLKTLNIV